MPPLYRACQRLLLAPFQNTSITPLDWPAANGAPASIPISSGAALCQLLPWLADHQSLPLVPFQKTSAPLPGTLTATGPADRPPLSSAALLQPEPGV